MKERRYFCSHPFLSDEKTPRPGDAFMQSAALTDDGYISSRIFVSWQPSVRARRLRQNFCERSGPQDLQGQVEGLEIRLSERSEFPYFPCSRLRRSCASSCFDGDDGEGRYYKLALCTIDLKNINIPYINSSSQLSCPGNIPIPPVAPPVVLTGATLTPSRRVARRCAALERQG